MFNIALLGENFNQLFVLKSWEDVLWTERFLVVGAFELRLFGVPYEIIQEAKYVFKSDSDYIGEIASREFTDKIVLKGAFLEDKLKTRFCMESKNYSGNAETVIRNMIYDNCILGDKAIERLELSPVNNNKGGQVSINMFGKNIQAEVQKLQLEHALSVKMLYDFDRARIVFSVWEGIDKRASEENPNYYDDEIVNILITKNLGNVLSEKYQVESYNVKNYIVVDGAGEGAARVRVIVDSRNGQPKNELYVDARHLQPTSGQTQQAYQEVLRQWGIAKANEYKEIQTIEISIDYAKLYMLRLGDIVTYRNDEYGIIAEGQITEFQDVAGTEFKKNIIIGKERLQIIQRIIREVT